MIVVDTNAHNPISNDIDMYKQAKYLIIGAGIHGLSTAYHLALELKATGKGSGDDILVIDKDDVGAGASGIACGVIRNNYFQSSMRKLMQHSVEVWESDAEAYSYHPVGYIQSNTSFMADDVAQIAKEQRAIGYESELIEGKADCDRYMKNLFNDWQAPNITTVLHEKKGGYANNMESLIGLTKKARSLGVRLQVGTTVTEIKFDSTGKRVTGVATNVGNIECDYLVVGVGPWVGKIWDMMSLPKRVKVSKNGKVTETDMWRYWCLQEGTLGVDPNFFKTDAGAFPPVIHCDSQEPLMSCADGSLITDKPWGIYYKPDFNFGGIQGGAAPYKIDTEPDQVKVDPYGTKSDLYTVTKEFALMWVSALAHCQKRFEGALPKYKDEPSGGIGAFTPDNFPVFDRFFDNSYIIADSNHGYKMLGVGKLVAEEICSSGKSDLLEPFRFSRYEKGITHPESNSPFPWS